MKISKIKLRDMMITREMDCPDLARAAGLSLPSVHGALNRGRCKMSTLGKIIKALGVGVQDVLDNAEGIEEVAPS